MKLERVIITGATSMLGLATVREFVDKDIDVVAISRVNSKRSKYLPNSKKVKYIECNLEDLCELKIEERCDALIHFGWGFTDRTTRDNPELQLKNIEYTMDAINIAHYCGCKVFMGAGSQAEYGINNDIISEKTPVWPNVCYGVTKYAAGILSHKKCEELGIKCVWLRIFSTYGEHDTESAMIPYALRQYKSGEVASFSSGEQYWDYLHIDDAAVYFRLLIENVRESITVNIGRGEGKKLKEYIKEIADVLGKDFQYELADDDGKPKVSIRPDVSLLKSITKYEPRVNFKEGITALQKLNEKL